MIEVYVIWSNHEGAADRIWVTEEKFEDMQWDRSVSKVWKVNEETIQPIE